MGFSEELQISAAIERYEQYQSRLDLLLIYFLWSVVVFLICAGGCFYHYSYSLGFKEGFLYTLENCLIPSAVFAMLSPAILVAAFTVFWFIVALGFILNKYFTIFGH